MKFSTRTLYGLRAVLVLASRYGQGSLAVSQIAKREDLSVAYLEQILNSLKKKGFVKSVRGPQGGYILSKKPAEISLAELFAALEGKNSWQEGVSAMPHVREHDEVSIGNAVFWGKLRAAVEKSLSETTLKSLLDEAGELKKSKSQVNLHNFHI